MITVSRDLSSKCITRKFEPVEHKRQLVLETGIAYIVYCQQEPIRPNAWSQDGHENVYRRAECTRSRGDRGGIFGTWGRGGVRGSQGKDLLLAAAIVLEYHGQCFQIWFAQAKEHK